MNPSMILHWSQMYTSRAVFSAKAKCTHPFKGHKQCTVELVCVVSSGKEKLPHPLSPLLASNKLQGGRNGLEKNTFVVAVVFFHSLFCFNIWHCFNRLTILSHFYFLLFEPFVLCKRVYIFVVLGCWKSSTNKVRRSSAKNLFNDAL